MGNYSVHCGYLCPPASVLQAVPKALLTILTVPHPTVLVCWDMGNTRAIVKKRQKWEKNREKVMLLGVLIQRPIPKYSSSTLGLQCFLRDYVRSSPVQNSTTRGTQPQLLVPGSAHAPCMGIKGAIANCFLSFWLQNSYFPNKKEETISFSLDEHFLSKIVLPGLCQNLQVFNFRFFFSTQYSVTAPSPFSNNLTFAYEVS